MILGKSWDTHGPTGPWLTTADEVADPQDLAIRTTVSGEVLQDGTTADMLWSIAEQIETLSTVATLEPGTIISTGTPAGVGAARTPPRFLVPGDEVVVEIEGLGRLANPVVAEPEPVPFALTGAGGWRRQDAAQSRMAPEVRRCVSRSWSTPTTLRPSATGGAGAGSADTPPSTQSRISTADRVGGARPGLGEQPGGHGRGRQRAGAVALAPRPDRAGDPVAGGVLAAGSGEGDVVAGVGGRRDARRSGRRRSRWPGCRTRRRPARRTPCPARRSTRHRRGGPRAPTGPGPTPGRPPPAWPG